MDNKAKKSQRPKWGVYLAVAVIVAALCMGVLFYIGWFNNNTHIDAPDGDNVTADYPIEEAQAQAPGENDWQNPEHNNVQEVIVDHADAPE